MLPQEIMDAIVGMVDPADVSSFKAFTLVSPSFCAAAQRILFRSLTLKGHGSLLNYIAASRLFAKSPHLGGYVSELKIDLPVGPQGSEASEGILLPVLAKLTIVRQCTINGPRHTWGLLCDAILADSLFRWPLEYLFLRGVRSIPLPALASLVTAVPALAFSDVTLRYTSDGDSSRIPRVSVTDLVLDKGTGTISHLFSSAGYAPPLRRLSIREEPDLPLIVAAAHTLQYLRVGSPASTQDTPIALTSIASLPALLSLEIETEFAARTVAWTRDTITGILGCKRRGGSGSKFRPLGEIVITYLPAWEYDPPDNYGAFLAQMDGVLSSFIPVPRLRWRLRFVGGGREEHFAMLVVFIAQEMPLMDAADRLVFETYEPKHWNEEFL